LRRKENSKDEVARMSDGVPLDAWRASGVLPLLYVFSSENKNPHDISVMGIGAALCLMKSLVAIPGIGAGPFRTENKARFPGTPGCNRHSNHSPVPTRVFLGKHSLGQTQNFKRPMTDIWFAA